MRDRFITWGTLDGARRLFTFELEAEDAHIIRRVLPPEGSSEAMMQTVINAWVQHTTIEYPAGTTRERIPFAATGSIVPEGAEVEDKLLVAGAEREWPFAVVSSLMSRQFRSELEELRDVVNGLEAFDDNLYERIKATWAKIQNEVNEKALLYEHLGPLRTLSDEMFARMKKLRRGKERERNVESKGVKTEFLAELAQAQTQLEEKRDLRKLFNALRDIQNRVNKASMSRGDRDALRKRLDELFKATKSEINATGADAGVLSSKRAGLESRLKGLEGAISRMRYSVERDNKDMWYEGQRADRANNQLAEQLAMAKLTMLGDKAKSKAARLDDMLATEADLRKKLAKLIAAEERAQAKRKESLAPSDAALVGSTDEGKAQQAKRSKTRSRDGDPGEASGRKNRRDRGPRGPVSPKIIKDAAAVLGAVANVGAKDSEGLAGEPPSQ